MIDYKGMKILKSTLQKNIDSLENKSILKRIATRAIILNENKILLLYTKRYDDYSLPGGGVDKGESIQEGLIREVHEETGAKNIRNIKPFGIYEEYRSWYKPEHDILHMLSYCFTCDIDSKLGETKYESYEVNNGMKPVWVDINKAIKHNENIITSSEKKGLSIERETFLLKLIKAQV